MRELLCAILAGLIIELLKEQGSKVAYAGFRLLSWLAGPELKKQYVDPWLGEAMTMEAGHLSKLTYFLTMTLSLVRIVIAREIARKDPLASALYVLPIVTLWVPEYRLLPLAFGLGLGMILSTATMAYLDLQPSWPHLRRRLLLALLAYVLVLPAYVIQDKFSFGLPFAVLTALNAAWITRSICDPILVMVVLARRVKKMELQIALVGVRQERLELKLKHLRREISGLGNRLE